MSSTRVKGGDRAAFVYKPHGGEDEPLLAAAREHFMAVNGVEGVGLGSGESGGDSLLVYVASDAAAAGLPKSFRGLPVVIRRTGRIRAY